VRRQGPDYPRVPRKFEGGKTSIHSEKDLALKPWGRDDIRGLGEAVRADNVKCGGTVCEVEVCRSFFARVVFDELVEYFVYLEASIRQLIGYI